MTIDATGRRKGHYLGTEIDETWWKRYWRHGLFARGTGEFWFDEAGLCFRRYLTKRPLRTGPVERPRSGV